MNLCIRLPFKRSPFLAVHFCRWGTQYSWRKRTIYKCGIGCGCLQPECGHARCQQKPTEVGHWKWLYWNGAWR